MQNIGQQLGYSPLENFRPHAALISTDAIGVELELEGFNERDIGIARNHLHPLWTITSDGSLRNGGVEFITTGGKGGETLYQAYERITTCLRDQVNYDASWRCSTHMHINMLDFTCNQVARFMLVYAACEPVMFELAGAARRSSNFCTPLADSLSFHRRLIARLTDDSVQHRVAAGNTSKYTALNFQPLFGNQNSRALGTVEFRGGRPMTTMEELLLQTNLLLSMKQFVRTFEGNEEAMLVKLSEGVFNTVFQNGCAASLDGVRVDDLDAALIHSWMLLKSYQEGMTNRPAPEARHSFGGTDWARAEQVAETLRRSQRAERTTAPRGATASGRLEGQLPASQRGAWSASRPTNRGLAYTNVIYESNNFGGEYAADRWPMLHRHLSELCNPAATVGRKASLMIDVLRDPQFARRIPSSLAIRTVMNWVLDIGRYNEPTPIGTLIRAVQNVSDGMRTGGLIEAECLDHNTTQGHQPPTMSTSINIDYTGALTQEAELRLCDYMQLPIGMLNNRVVWNWFMNVSVTLINKPALIRAYEVRTEQPSGAWQTCADVITAAQAYYLLRIVNGKSEDYIRSEDLPMYDRLCAAMNVLINAGLHFPVIHRTGGVQLGTSMERRLYVTNTRQCTLAYAARMRHVQEHQTHSPRLSPTTGQRVY